MAAQNPSVLARIKRAGMGVISPHVGLTSLHKILSDNVVNSSQIIINPFQWSILLMRLNIIPAVFMELIDTLPRPSPIERLPEIALQTASNNPSTEMLAHQIKDIVLAILGIQVLLVLDLTKLLRIHFAIGK
jgi:hypothetical protein